MLKTAKEAHFPQVLWRPDHNLLQGQVVFPNSMDTQAKKQYIPPVIHEGVSRDCVGKMRAVTVRDDPSSRNLLFICTNRESYNRKQTPGDLNDLLIPRQKGFSNFFSFSYTRSQTYISLMLKQQASLFVAYKLTFLQIIVQKKKNNQSNQHSVYIKSALIIIFTQSRTQVTIKPSFMFPVLFFFFKITFQFITC